MDSVRGVLSKLKRGLDSVIDEYKKSVSDIEKEEDFIQILGDVVNYSKSDCLLLPFYDETILSRVFDRLFPSSSYMKKLKTARYLIDASKSVDKSNFLQYNNAVKDLEEINGKLIKIYDEMLSNDKLKTDKENYLNKINLYSDFVVTISDDEFTAIISDIDLFQEMVELCNFKEDELNILLSCAIKCNLKFLDSNGVITTEVHSDIADMKSDNDKMQEEINNLSDLLETE
jgi:hypothetical protein